MGLFDSLIAWFSESVPHEVITAFTENGGDTRSDVDDTTINLFFSDSASDPGVKELQEQTVLVLQPKWITESLEQQKRLPYTPHLLPTQGYEFSASNNTQTKQNIQCTENTGHICNQETARVYADAQRKAKQQAKGETQTITIIDHKEEPESHYETIGGETDETVEEEEGGADEKEEKEDTNEKKRQRGRKSKRKRHRKNGVTITLSDTEDAQEEGKLYVPPSKSAAPPSSSPSRSLPSRGSRSAKGRGEARRRMTMTLTSQPLRQDEVWAEDWEAEEEETHTRQRHAAQKRKTKAEPSSPAAPPERSTATAAVRAGRPSRASISTTSVPQPRSLFASSRSAASVPSVPLSTLLPFPDPSSARQLIITASPTRPSLQPVSQRSDQRRTGRTSTTAAASSSAATPFPNMSLAIAVQNQRPGVSMFHFSEAELALEGIW